MQNKTGKEMLFIWFIGELFFMFTPLWLQAIWAGICIGQVVHDTRENGPETSQKKINSFNEQKSFYNNFKSYVDPKFRDQKEINENIYDWLKNGLPGTRFLIKQATYEDSTPLRMALVHYVDHYWLLDKDTRNEIKNNASNSDFYYDATNIIHDKKCWKYDPTYIYPMKYLVICDVLQLYRMAMKKNLWENEYIAESLFDLRTINYLSIENKRDYIADLKDGIIPLHAKILKDKLNYEHECFKLFIPPEIIKKEICKRNSFITDPSIIDNPEQLQKLINENLTADHSLREDLVLETQQ